MAADVPILFLDVDGVINLFGAWEDTTPEGSSIPFRGHPDHLIPLLFPELAGKEMWVLIDPEVTVRIKQLQDVFDIVWASLWEDRVEAVEDVLGVGPFRYLGFDFPEGFEPSLGVPSGACKHTTLTTVAGTDRPVVFIDDEPSEDTYVWALNRTLEGTPTLVLRADPTTGLTSDLVKRAMLFAGYSG